MAITLSILNGFIIVVIPVMKDFKYMLGTWKVVSTCYGGLIHVKVLYIVNI